MYVFKAQTKGETMAFKNILPYKLKRLLPILGLMGATLTGCDKDEYYIIVPPCQCPQQPGDKDDSDDNKDPGTENPGDDENPGTEDPKPEIKTHETTYVWGRIRTNNELIKNICASADSVEVSRVILANDGDTFGNTMSEKYIKEFYIDYIINKVTPENRHKLCGARILKDVKRESADAEKFMKDFGFDIRYYGEPVNTTVSSSQKNTNPPLRYAIGNNNQR